MSTAQKIYKVDGEKIENMVLAENEIRLVNKSFGSIEEFNELWDKKITLTHKIKIEYSDIKSITKEDAENEIVISYSGGLGTTKTCKIDFRDDQDRESFYAFIQNDKGFSRTDEVLSPFAASRSLIISLLVIIAIAVFAYFQAVAVESPDFVENDDDSRSGRKTRFFHMIVGTLGPNGVLLIGLALAGFVGYKIWNRYKNPPLQTKFVPTR